MLAAGDGSGKSRAALDALCRSYWYPLYSFLRRKGHPHHQAEDLTQGFFSIFLTRQDLARVRQEKGRFRSFLLTALKNHVSDQRSHDRAQKRGGNRKILPLDIATAEERYSLEPAHDLTPERLFDRQWAKTLIDQALAELRSRYVAQGHEKLFDLFKVYLVDQSEQLPLAQMAVNVQMSEGAVKVAIHRLRRRFRELLRAVVATTVANEDEVDDELRSLLEALRS